MTAGAGLAEAYRRAGVMLRSARRLRVVSHLDLDGVGAAAILARSARLRGGRASISVTGARGVYKAVLRELRHAAAEGGLVVAADVSPGGRGAAAAVASGMRYGQRLLWLDHHVWEPGVVEELERAGALVLIDRSRVTAEIAYLVSGLEGDETAKTIVEVARADDSCTEDPLGLAPKWRLVLRVLGPREAARAAEALARGDLWPDWADKLYREHSQRYYDEIRRLTSVNTYEFEGLRIAVLTPPPRANACDVETIVEPPDADLLLVLYPRGISIRSLGRLRADCIAKKLGGGGHPKAAGAPRPSTTMGAAQVARMVARAAEGCG